MWCYYNFIDVRYRQMILLWLIWNYIEWKNMDGLMMAGQWMIQMLTKCNVTISLESIHFILKKVAITLIYFCN